MSVEESMAEQKAYGCPSMAKDLIMEFLLRLPPTHLLRLKRVCREWYVLISNPHFFRLHSIQFHQTQIRDCMVDCLILRPITYYPFVLPQNEDQNTQQQLKLVTKKVFYLGLFIFLRKEGLPLSVSEDIMVVDSCNGLLLYRRSGTRSRADYTYYVSNPIMKQHIKLPKIDIEEELGLEIVFGYTPHLVFDPSRSLTYKVFKCLKYGGTNLHDLYVYSSETRSWRLMASFPYESHFDFKCALLNGVLYWSTYGDVSLCVDVTKESVIFMALPQKPFLGLNTRRKCLYFGECGGRLRLIEKFFVGDRRVHGYLHLPCRFDVMEMEQLDGDLTTWTVKYRVNIEAGCYDHLGCRYPIVYILYHYDAGSKGEQLLFNVDGAIVTFNLTSNTFGPAEPSDRDYEDFRYAVLPYTSTSFPLP